MRTATFLMIFLASTVARGDGADRPSAPVAPAPTAPAPSPGADNDHPPRAEEPPGPSLRRNAWARFSVGLFMPPSFFSDFGGDQSPDGGFWFRAGLTIANQALVVWIPIFRLHGTFGYSGRYWAIGIDVGGGVGLYPKGALAGVDLGPAFRIGRVDGTHVRPLLYWYVYPVSRYVFPVPGGSSLIPAGGELSLLVPAGPATWLQLLLHSDFSLGMWGSLLAGAQHQIAAADSRGGRNYLSWGVGASLGLPALQGLLELAYERRF